MTRVVCLVTAALALIAAAHADAAIVKIAFYRNGAGYMAQRVIADPPTASAAVELLLQGPTAEESADGVMTAIPPGTYLISLAAAGDGAIVELSRDVLAGLDDARLEILFRQFVYTLAQFGLDADVRVNVDGKPLSSYLAPVPAPVYTNPPAAARTPVAGVGLSGKRITLSPGHGYLWTGSSWATQRGIVCGYQQEDFRDIDIATWLKKYLEQDGAYVQVVREHNKNRGTGPSGHPWWQEAAYVWLHDAGYSCAVTASYTGECSVTGSVHHSNDDIRSRPLASNLDSRGNTDIYLSVHTNAFDGTAKGTTVWYCNTNPYPTASIDLCDKIGSAVVSAIQNAGEKCADGTTWGCLGGLCTRQGDLGEVRIPARPAALIELGFHDNCTADAPKLEEPFFQSVAMWGEYKGVCTYFGNTPTWDMYSDEYVSDTIPAVMAPGETRSVSITLRNRGVLWTSSKGFKLGAVGDSDPFTGTIRHTVGSDTGPGDTYTFTFNLTAPTTPGYYTTDWRMIREGYEWFGVTVSKSINVGGPPDTEPPTVPTIISAQAVSSTEIGITWVASTDNTGVVGYKVYRNGSLLDTSLVVGYLDTSCVPDTTYSYTVSAYDGAGNESAQSAPVCLSSRFQTDFIIDEEAATYTGSWTNATGPSPDCYNGDYKYGITASSETATAIWRPSLVRAGTYAVYVYYRQGSNRTQYAPYTIYYSGGSQTYLINQETNGGQWVLLGTKPFAAGTSGYVKLGNNTADTGEAVIADAVKFTFVSGGAASTPTDQTPVVNGSNSITWKWCNVNDETGYRVKDTGGVNKSGDLAANTWQWTENTLVDNTQYTRRVYAFNVYGESAGSAGQTAWTLAKVVESPSGSPFGNVWCTTASKNTWYPAGKTFTFSNPQGFGTGGKASKFEYKWNRSTTETWATAGTTWNSGTISLTANQGDGDYYLHVRAFNAENAPNNVEILDYGPFKSDSTPPSAVTVTDEGSYTPSLNTLKASWTASSDSGSGLAQYEYAVGTSPTSQDVKGWSGAGLNTSATASNLSLVEGNTYYFQVRAKDAAGNFSTASSANGILAAPGVSSISSAWSYSNDTQPISLRNKVVTAKIGGAFWLEEDNRTGAIRVLSSASVDRGNTVSVAGVLKGDQLTRYLLGDVVINSGGNSVIAPLGLTSRWLGGGSYDPATPGVTGGIGQYNIGMLVRVWGTVTYLNSTDPNNKYFYLDDGSGLSSGGHSGVKVWCGTLTPPTSGTAIVTGIVSAESIGGKTVPVILVRSEADINAF